MAIDRAPVLIVLTAKGLDLAARVADVLPAAEIHGHAARVPDAPVGFARVADHLQDLFRLLLQGFVDDVGYDEALDLLEGVGQLGYE